VSQGISWTGRARTPGLLLAGFVFTDPMSVRGAHTGFPGKASGQFYVDAREDMKAIVERLMAERP